MVLAGYMDGIAERMLVGFFVRSRHHKQRWSACEDGTGAKLEEKSHAERMKTWQKPAW